MTIDWLKDKNTGEKFYPRTHEDAVLDSNNVTLSTKLAAITASIPEDKVFLVTYGTTTATQVIAAISDNKIPVCFYNDRCYVYSHVDTNYYYFYCVSDKLYWIKLYGDTPTWTSGNNSYELSTNKVISLSSGSTDTQYPSAKCVYNAIQAAAGSAGVSSYDELTNRPALSTTATTAQATAASETISGTISLHKVAKTGTYSDLIGTPTIPTVGTLNTNNAAAQATATSESLSGTIKLHKVAKTGTYSDLIGTPTIPSPPGTLSTSATTALATASTEALSSTINLHKIAKTGTYSDLIGTPTIPTVGTLSTTATTAQATATSESLSGAINLHKIAKTGTYSDLIGKPTIPSAPGTLSTTATTALATASTEALSGAINLHKISKTGSYNDLVGKPTLPSYCANVPLSLELNYVTEPEFKNVKINGGETNVQSTKNCQLQYDTVNNCLKFVFN